VDDGPSGVVVQVSCGCPAVGWMGHGGDGGEERREGRRDYSE
ncbi:15620_t:CDS:1, partial [Acaulospora colombiana]